MEKSEKSWLLRGDVRVSTTMITCTDGVALATDTYTSFLQVGPLPTIVERTPYGRTSADLREMAEFFVARGYNVVLQDTRGRGDSEGMFRHYISDPHEGEDGAALLDWIVEQPWSDGTVGTVGMSYTGSNQQSLAVMNHPALRAQVIFDAGINYGRRTVREEGAFVLGQLGTYALRMALSSPQARKDPKIRAELEAARDCAPDWFRKAPWRAGFSPVSALPEYEEWLLFAQDATGSDARWNNPQMNIEPYLEDYPDIPVLYFSSWYGHHVWSTLLRAERIKHHQSPKPIVIGTWLHADPYGFQSHTGDVEFGPEASLSTNELRLRWFDEHLKGRFPADQMSTPAVSYFRMGRGGGVRDSTGRLVHGGSWKQTDVWPPIGGIDLELFLHAGGALRDETAPAGTDNLVTDLDRPIPAVGGSIKNPDIIPMFFREGAQDQREWHDVLDSPGSALPLATRPDVAAFSTVPFVEATDITGPIYIDLWLSCTSPAGDLSIKIIDEYPTSGDLPQGYSLNIADFYRRFASWTEALPVGRAPMKVTVGPVHVSNVFDVGHRLRVDIGTSSWPRFDKNPEAQSAYVMTIHSGQGFESVVRGSGVVQQMNVEIIE